MNFNAKIDIFEVTIHAVYSDVFTIIRNENFYMGFWDIIDQFELDRQDVKNKLKSFNFELIDTVDIIYFKNKEDAIKTVEWLDSLVLSDKLKGGT